MIRTRPAGRGLARRQMLRAGFAAIASLTALELAAVVALFLRVTRPPLALGAPIGVGSKAELLRQFAGSRDAPILHVAGRFWLLHAPGGIIAAYRKCTHLGCTVPWDAQNDRFTCPCHGLQFDKHTAVVLKSPAPKPLQLFHMSETESGALVVDTNPLRVIDRADNRWDPAHLEIRA